MEFITGFFIGYLANTVGLVTLLLCALLFDIFNSTKTVVFLMITAAIAAYVGFDIPLNIVLGAAIGYFAIGVLWSVWRYKRFVNAELLRIYKNENCEKKLLINWLAPKHNTSKILYWIFVWPISAINALVGDFIHMATAFVQTFFKGVYETLYTNSINQFEQKDRQ